MQTFLDSTDKTELEGKIQENSEAINKLKDALTHRYYWMNMMSVDG